MNNHTITGLKATLECDLEILSDLSKLIQSKGFESIDEYFKHLLDDNIKSELKNFSLDEIIEYFINCITDNQYWASGETYFNSQRTFTFIDAYKILKEVDSEFPYPDWEQISQNCRIALDEAFKQGILEHAAQAKDGDFYIEIKDKTMSYSLLYQLYKKVPS